MENETIGFVVHLAPTGYALMRAECFPNDFCQQFLKGSAFTSCAFDFPQGFGFDLSADYTSFNGFPAQNFLSY